MKKFISVLLVIMLIFSLGACSPKEKVESSAFENLKGAIDLEFSKEVIGKLSEFGDDPVTGNRSAGSPAEKEAGEYLFGLMEEIGLSNVTKDSVTVDGWTYKGANITYKDENGKDQKIALGGYATNLVAQNEIVPLVYLDEGKAEDYEGLDVNGKLVLIDIDQNENWWINYPAYQAKLKGAKAVIAMSIMPEENGERIGSQDICGPADAPAYGISDNDSKALQVMIEASEKEEIEVVFNSDSTITPDTETYNIWGEIPGTSDQVIYILGHYDGYFHSDFDNASGIATGLSIAKALIDSGYKPQKTIRIIAHAAEEFGKSGTEYDWATGAYEQIMTKRPEWAETAFAAVNIDGAYPINGEESFGVNSSHELYNFMVESAKPVADEYDYETVFRAPASTGTEDFGWTVAGIPSIVATHGDECLYYDAYYHSNMDTIEAAGLNEDAYKMNHELYGKIVLDLDAKPVRPMDFATRFEYMAESIDTEVIADKELIDVVNKAVEGGKAFNKAVTAIEADGDAKAISEMNKILFDCYKLMQDNLLTLDFNSEVLFPHEQYQANVTYLRGALEALEKGDVETALDEYLCSVDFAWYATAFDKEVCDYFVEQLFNNRAGTWGDNMIKNPICDLDSVIRSLGEKYEIEGADVELEITKIKEQLAMQEQYLQKAIDGEKAFLKEFVEVMSYH